MENLPSSSVDHEHKRRGTAQVGQKNHIKSTIINRNKITEQMRQQKQEYYEEWLKIEREKLEVEKQKLTALIDRNELIKQRNELLQKSHSSANQ